MSFGNAATGALTGAGIGSSFGPVGAAAGGLLGGIGGLFGFGKSKADKIKKLPIYDKAQTDYLNQVLQGAQGGNQNAFDYLNSILSNEEGAFEDFEGPELERFYQQTIPNILERVGNRGMSKGGSALNQTLAQAGRGLSGDLASQRARLKQNAISQLMQFSEQGLRSKTSPYIQQGKAGAFEQLAPLAGQSIGNSFYNLINDRYSGGGSNNIAPPGIASAAIGNPNVGANIGRSF